MSDTKKTRGEWQNPVILADATAVATKFKRLSENVFGLVAGFYRKWLTEGVSLEIVGKHIRYALNKLDVNAGTIRGYCTTIEAFVTREGFAAWEDGMKPSAMMKANTSANAAARAEKSEAAGEGEKAAPVELTNRQKLLAELAELVSKLDDADVSAIVIAARELAEKAKPAEGEQPEEVPADEIEAETEAEPVTAEQPEAAVA